MIPQFPDFIKLNPSHKSFVQEITKTLPPYSDHNFTSLLMWDVNYETEFSILNNNLVIKFKDYESDKQFYSFIGKNNLVDTIEKLLTYSRNQGHGNEILLLPKDNFTDLEIESLSQKYDFKEDRNNFDYILNIDELASFSGSNYLNKRNKLNHFLKNHSPKVVISNLIDKNFQQELIQCFNDWVEAVKITKGEAFVNYDEIKAFNKLLANHEFFDVLTIAVYVDEKMQGFSLFEIIDQNYAQHPFQKANKNYKGVYEFLYNNMAKYLQERGVKYLNIYQDLGHEGMRKGKMDYNPTFLKKYSLAQKSTD